MFDWLFGIAEAKASEVAKKEIDNAPWWKDAMDAIKAFFKPITDMIWQWINPQGYYTAQSLEKNATQDNIARALQPIADELSPLGDVNKDLSNDVARSLAKLTKEASLDDEGIKEAGDKAYQVAFDALHSKLEQSAYAGDPENTKKLAEGYGNSVRDGFKKYLSKAAEIRNKTTGVKAGGVPGKIEEGISGLKMEFGLGGSGKAARDALTLNKTNNDAAAKAAGDGADIIKQDLNVDAPNLPDDLKAKLIADLTKGKTFNVASANDLKNLVNGPEYSKIIEKMQQNPPAAITNLRVDRSNGATGLIISLNGQDQFLTSLSPSATPAAPTQESKGQQP